VSGSATPALAEGGPGPVADAGLVAVGCPGTVVIGLRREQLAALVGPAETTGQLAALLNGWISGLTAGVMRARTAGKATLLEAGPAVQLAAGGVASPGRQVLWLRHLEGHSRFLGKAALPLTSGDGWFPLSAPGWLTAGPQGASLETVTTESLLGQSCCWNSLDRFHRMVLACVAVNVREADATERLRLRRRARSEDLVMQEALARLARVSQPETVDGLAAGLEGGPLLVACRLVGARLGIDFQPPQGTSERRRRSDPVAAIVRASRVRMRRVLLHGDWWRRDNGPLLAYRAEDEEPVALLPSSPSRYELVDPVNRTRTPVTAANASSLLPFAYSFYRPFAARALTSWDLFRFSLLGSGRDWLLVVLLGFTASLLGLFTPLVTGWVFDWIIPGAERTQLLLVVLVLAASATAAALFQLTRGIAVSRLETRMESNLQAGLQDRLLDLPAPFFRRFSAGDLADRSLGIAAIRQILTGVVLSTLLSAVFSLVNFGLLFYYHVRLALLACGLFGIVLLVTGVGAYLQWRYQRRLSQVRGKIVGMVLQLITGLSRLRIAGAEERALALWAREFSAQKRLGFRARSVAINLLAFNAAAPLLAAMALFSTVSLLPLSELSLGSFLAFNVAFVQVLYAALLVTSLIGSAVEIVPLHERARPILETPPEVDAARSHPGDLSGDIEISHVSFRYQPDGPLILDDISVRIRPGEFVAFVGPSGAGKSTIIRLLLGFETPTAGSIYYDHLVLTGLDPQAVRRQMGVVLQDGKILAGDIFSNIIGSSLLTLEDAWEAAWASGLGEDIEQMPMGMFTVLSEGGTTLSGGQRQRLMIARAIVSKPRILLFDEATSALDNATQVLVSQSLERLEATRVVVAHRLSTVRQADRIYVVDRGRIVQSGSYAELMQAGGLFSELAHRQLV
jgi:NHLM bacteriocin system ABC transporter ATP-binding protein